MVAPHSSQTKRAHELTRDKFVATVHKINSKKLTAKELFLVFKHVNGGKEAQCASLLMIRKVFNKKNPVAPSSKLAMLMERGLGMPRGNLIMNVIKRLQMGEIVLQRLKSRVMMLRAAAVLLSRTVLLKTIVLRTVLSSMQWFLQVSTGCCQYQKRS